MTKKSRVVSGAMRVWVRDLEKVLFYSFFRPACDSNSLLSATRTSVLIQLCTPFCNKTHIKE